MILIDKKYPLILLVPFFLCFPAIWAVAQSPASIEGAVKRPDGSGVAGVRIVLNRQGSVFSTALVVNTDDSGTFKFSNLVAGNYQLFATRDGYVPAEFGQRSPNGPGQPLPLASGENLRDVAIRMMPTGTISGRVYDNRGEPAGFVQVRAERATYSEGRRTLTMVQTTRTNDLGEYRLFWLRPGRYIVSVLPTEAVNGTERNARTIAAEGNVDIELRPGGLMEGVTGQTVRIAEEQAAQMGFVSAIELRRTYVPAYFPTGAPDTTSATPVDLHSGEDINGINVRIAPVPVVRIRGRVSGLSPMPQGFSLNLVPRGSDSAIATQRPSTFSNDLGTFEFQGVVPGSYDIVAAAGGFGGFFSVGENAAPMTRINRVDAPPGLLNRPVVKHFGARVPVDVGSVDLENISVVLQAGTTVSGRISIPGLPASEVISTTSSVGIQFFPYPSNPVLTPVPAMVSSDGTFVVNDVVPGTYQISVFSRKLPPGAYIQSVSVAGLNSTGSVNVTGRDSIEIVVGTDSGALDAVVRDSSRPQAAFGIVVLVPAVGTRPDLFKYAPTDPTGRARFQGIIPGEYEMFAWEDLEFGAWWDPAFLTQYRNRARSITIAPNGRQEVELELIRTSR